MDIVRAKNSFGVSAIKKYIVADRFHSKEDYAAHFCKLLKEQPDETLMLIIFGVNDQIHGFIFAARHETDPCVWLYQMWTDNTVSIKIKKSIFEKLEFWTYNVVGLNEIRGETFRDEFKAMESYGWKPYSTVMYKILGDKL